MGALLGLVLCLYLPCLFSQSVTQKPLNVSKNECESLTITCAFNEYHWYYTYHFESGTFFKQTQTATEWERISSGGRFVLSTDKAQKTFSLKIRDARVEDTATYYCKAQYSCYAHSDRPRLPVAQKLSQEHVDGPGTMVTVTPDSSTPISQRPLVQTSPAGDNVTLSCKYSESCQYTVYWYNQSPGQAPKYLLQRDTTGEAKKENAAGLRISESFDPQAKISQLMISRIQLSDSAVYYCARSRQSARTLIQAGEYAIADHAQTQKLETLKDIPTLSLH
ncbi:uncharacterized protein LOC132814080 [Hemiscyllium ocellatum]|uniref:uncharacterized protein LOC132814080 n=1 Tax=Hemiscyllium ocellatum TaxID=170820 RepID=UPI002967456E|nr:uncharacterized protein LOC132814080 [Hemiscyllium ocellatum]